MAAASSSVIGSKLSVVSNSEMRYEGTLWKLDPETSTFSLAQVRSFGTEDRRKDKFVHARDEIYEFIVFRGSDIKDIRLCGAQRLFAETPRAFFELMKPHDDAIIQMNISSASTAHGPGPCGALTARRGSSVASNESHPISIASLRSAPEITSGVDNYRGRCGGEHPHSTSFNNGGQRNGFFHRGRGSRGNYKSRHNEGSPPESKSMDRNFKKKPNFNISDKKFEVKEKTHGARTVSASDNDTHRSAHARTDKVEKPVKSYDPKKFFDSISCEALEKQQGVENGRPTYDREKQRKINAITFGLRNLISKTSPTMNRSRPLDNQSRETDGRDNYRRSLKWNNNGMQSLNSNYVFGPDGGKRAGNSQKGGQRQQQPISKERPSGIFQLLKGASTHNPHTKAFVHSNANMIDDWVFDAKKAAWVNYPRPIEKRNQPPVGNTRATRKRRSKPVPVKCRWN